MHLPELVGSAEWGANYIYKIVGIITFGSMSFDARPPGITVREFPRIPGNFAV